MYTGDFNLKRLNALSPSEVLRARAAAAACREYGFIYASFHPDSNFRQNFQCANEYVEYAESTVSGLCAVEQCRILHENIDEDCARIFYFMQITLPDGEDASYYEVADLERLNSGWRYLRGYKLLACDVHDSANIESETVVERGICL